MNLQGGAVEMPAETRRWTLRRRPAAALTRQDLEHDTVALKSLADGEVVVRNLWLSCSPQMREWIDGPPAGSAPPVKVGDVVRCPAVAQVIGSRSPKYPAGALVMGLFGWQEHAIVHADARWGDDGDPAREWTGMGRIKPVPEGIHPRLALGALGTNGLAAWLGLSEIARVRAGERVVVTGAAGATGSLAGQIAKLMGCTVVGIANGPAKCRALTAGLNFDAALDRNSPVLEAQLREACPGGFDIVFDTVQGPVLGACLANLARHARVVLCGGASLAGTGMPQPVHGMINAIWKRATLRGFSVYEFPHMEKEVLLKLSAWTATGQLKTPEDIQSGFDSIPDAFIGMAGRTGLGKRLVHLSDPV